MGFPFKYAMIHFLVNISLCVNCKPMATPEIILLPSNTPTHQTNISSWNNRYTLKTPLDVNQSISLRCRSNEPTRWIIWNPDQTIHGIDMDKIRIKSGNESEFLSDLVWRFNASDIRITFFDCLHETDWAVGRLQLNSLRTIVGSNVVIKRSTRNNTTQLGIEITINHNSSVADFHIWNQSEGEVCSNNLTFVASNGKIHPKCAHGKPESAHGQPCGNLDECDSFSLWHIMPSSRYCEADFSSFSGESGLNSLSLPNYTSPTIFFCGETYEDSWWRSFATVFPSFRGNTSDSYVFYGTFEEAVGANSIHVTLPNYSDYGELLDFDFPFRTMAFAINETIEVACIAVKFLYMRGVQWQLGPNQIVADQGTQTFFAGTKRSLLVTRRNITFDLNLFGNSSSWVACKGPIWNSESWQTSQRLNFNLFAPSPPAGNLTHTVNEDGLDEFRCNYTGWPKPKITWIFSGNVTTRDMSPNANKRFPESPNDTWSETRVVITERSSSYSVSCILLNFKGETHPTVMINVPSPYFQEFVIGGLVFSILLLILVLALVYWGWRRNWNCKPSFKKTTDRNEDAELLCFNRNFELSIKDCSIHKNKLLGSGAFGTVHEGQVKGKTVAMKQPNSDFSKTAFESILCELKVLSHLGTNKNVVRFIGAYIKEIEEGYLLIAIELCTNGSLESHLRKKTSVQEKNNANGLPEDAIYSSELYRYSFEIASGMSYIESRNIVHGDLATRNVLLNQFNVCKITDFGLSRKMYEYQSYLKTSQQPLPWKWMAYESLTKMKFTSKSDVWSYGVTLWEIFSLGNVPYGGLNWTTDFTNDLKRGLRLSIPEFAPRTIYDKMLKCWDINSDKRPTFNEMAEFCKHFCTGQYIQLS